MPTMSRKGLGYGMYEQFAVTSSQAFNDDIPTTQYFWYLLCQKS